MSEVRLIDANALPFHECADSDCIEASTENCAKCEFRCVTKEEIDNAPTVDLTKNQAYDKGFITAIKLYARPQGEWIIVKDKKWGDNVKCPFCGKELAGTDLNFCVKCGADMRKGGNNEKL